MSDVDDMQSWIDDAGEALARREAAQRPRPSFEDVLQRASAASGDASDEVELTGWVADAREGLDRRIDGAALRAGFDDVLARGHALRPDLVDARMLADARRLAPVVDLQRRAAGDRVLEAFVDDARESVEKRIRDRAMLHRRRRIVVRAAGAAALVAAALFAVVWWVGAPNVLESAGSGLSSGVEQAELIETREEEIGEAKSVRPEPVPTPKIEVEPTPAPAPAMVETVPQRVRSQRRIETPTLAELAAVAKEQWRAGDLDAAESTLTRIVERGGASKWADNAFSDLFALAHRRGDAKARQHWWRAYLRRFPRGRYADDAQAGLCRASAQASCWAKYLDRYPDGSYRGEAQRMVKGE